MSAPIASRFNAGVAFLTLDRPEKRNALDRATISALRSQLAACAADPEVRVVQITGAGTTFCAGADLGDMRAAAEVSEEVNLADARELAALLADLDNLRKPTLARVNGDGYGGALGILGACDIVVAVEHARFAFTEVRLGIIPAVISPFVLGKIGERTARRYFLTAETLTAQALREYGLVHEVVAAEQLDGCCSRIIEELLKGAPGAQAQAKALIREVGELGQQDRGMTASQMAARLARLRTEPEAQEGFAAFFDKRKANWRKD